MAADIIGDSSVGHRLSVLTDLLHAMYGERVSDLISSATLCTVGPVAGLSRASRSLGSVATITPALRLTQQMAETVLMQFENCPLWHLIVLAQHDREQTQPTGSRCTALASAFPTQSHLWKK